ncbi:tRNA (N(6)-L-threonylcarbamoyladenosine(37)-C(2))-methylthiotransferase [Candidatus Woesearchaeota archaeon]|nr:tRNA (N(6)-L-threonylcarbamoyladenosine(37)-C(2))-methylthiotransferase [Candidatus Woesearchaeota archaeon]
MTSVYFLTQGCSANRADTEQMQGLLLESDFTIENNLEDADIVVFNTCTVKTPSESSFFTKLDEIKKQYPYKIIVIAGCIAQADRKRLKDYCLIGTRQIQSIVEVIEEALNDNIVHALETGEMPPLSLPKVRKNPVVEIIPIGRGCLSACTFCKTKQARGNLQSYSIEDVVSVARKGIQEGVKEIWLTSQDTFCYGFDLDTDLSELLKELVSIPGNFKIRVGMGNPVHLPKIKDSLFPLMANEKVFRFLHIPAQVGSTKVLKEMLRGNTNEEYLAIIEELKTMIPDITLATDIIVGYPTETEDDYWETLQLLRKITPDVVNISKFWSRPGTSAAKLEELPQEEVKRRAKVVTDIFHNISTLQNEKWRGWEGTIVIDEKGKFENQWVGRNYTYKPVIVEGSFKLGDTIDVKIVKTTMFDLRGEVV